jgi:methionine-S-sulfoxide reductase
LIVSFEEILDVYFNGIDPTDSGGQFVDRGRSYTTAIFYHTGSQKKAAEMKIIEINQSKKFDASVVTVIEPFTTFYKAEEYHQDFYLKSPERYNQYTSLSGRDAFKQRAIDEINKSR